MILIKAILILLLIVGFIISVINVFAYSLDLKHINAFKKELLIFREGIENYKKTNIIPRDSIDKLLELRPIYENSNLYKTYNENSNIWATGYWLSNIEHFFQNSNNFYFEELNFHVQNTLNECYGSIGFNTMCRNSALIKLIPIYYIDNIVWYISDMIVILKGEFSPGDITRKNSFTSLFSFLASVLAFLELFHNVVTIYFFKP